MRNPTDLRQKVLDASLTLIEEGGLDRLSMREVARKAGVSHQAPYHYFDDREAILAALAGEGFSKLGQSLMRAAAQASA
jgi:AcrR family transcriptional regulator